MGSEWPYLSNLDTSQSHFLTRHFKSHFTKYCTTCREGYLYAHYTCSCAHVQHAYNGIRLHNKVIEHYIMANTSHKLVWQSIWTLFSLRGCCFGSIGNVGDSAAYFLDCSLVEISTDSSRQFRTQWSWIILACFQWMLKCLNQSFWFSTWHKVIWQGLRPSLKPRPEWTAWKCTRNIFY